MNNIPSNWLVDELLLFAREKQPEIYKNAENQLREQLKKMGKNYDDEKDKALTQALLKAIITKTLEKKRKK